MDRKTDRNERKRDIQTNRKRTDRQTERIHRRAKTQRQKYKKVNK